MTLRLGGDGAITGCTSLENPDLTVSGLTISGSFDAEKVLVASGTAAAPSYTFSGDTDNGLYYAGTNSIGLATAGTNAILIDSSGRVGIGTTSPAHNLEVRGTFPDIAITDSDTANDKFRVLYNSGSCQLQVDPNNVSSGSHLLAAIDGTERLRIDSSGNVGIGTTSPASTLLTGTIVNTSGGSKSGYRAYGGGTAVAHLYQRDDLTILGSGENANAKLAFNTGAGLGTERMRIDSSGRLLVGTSSAIYNFKTELVNNGSVLAVIDTNDGDTGSRVPFTVRTGTFSSSDTTSLYMNMIRGDGTQRGRIRSNGATSVAYESASDYRLKENVVPLSNALQRFLLLKPYRFNFIDDGPDRTVDGFLAHEVQEVVPEAAGGVKDQVDDDGNPVYQGTDQSKLVPLLTAALQEAIAKIETLETRLTALEAQ